MAVPAAPGILGPVKVARPVDAGNRVCLAHEAVRIDDASEPAGVAERDRLDATRKVAPLRPAAGAVEIDSTGKSVEAIVERIATLAEAVGRN